MQTNALYTPEVTTIQKFLPDAKIRKEGTKVIVNMQEIDMMKSAVKNSEFTQRHVRGEYCARQNRLLMEFSVLASKKGYHAVTISGDDKSSTPLIIDATSHLFNRNRRMHLRGQERDYYDHSWSSGPAIKISGYAITKYSPQEADPDMYAKNDPHAYSEAKAYEKTDHHRRKYKTALHNGVIRYPRPRAEELKMFLRGTKKTRTRFSEHTR